MSGAADQLRAIEEWPLFVALVWIGRAIVVFWALVALCDIVRWIATRRDRWPYPTEPGSWAHVPRKDWPRRKRWAHRKHSRQEHHGQD